MSGIISVKYPRLGIFFLVAAVLAGMTASAFAASSSSYYLLQTFMSNMGVVPGAAGRIDGSLTHKVNANSQQLKLALSGLAPQTPYQLIAYIGENANPVAVTDLTTDARGACLLNYVQKCPGNTHPGGVELPSVLDPITRIHQLDLAKDGTVVLSGLIGSDLRADCTAPAVTLTTPVDKASGVAVNQDISVSFSEPMNPATLTPATFVVKRGVTLVPGTVSCSGTTATFNPTRDLAPGTVYTAIVTTRARDFGGNGPSSNIVWTFTTVPQKSTAAAQIGYTNALAVTSYSQTLMNQIGQFRWFFAHASVGDNIKQGIADLHQANPGFYQLQYQSVTGTPAGTTAPGVIYEFMRGNPGWQAKVDSFDGYVNNGWHYPLVDAAMNKLCWIDQTADVNSYISSLANLEAAYPQTTFVYMTMPLDTTTSADNYARNVFNDTLRTWCRTNNRLLFDVADIEAHDANGNPVTFTYNNRTCQRLYSDYSSDGGHPDSAYARQMLARGFYAVAASLIARSAQ